MKYSWIKKTQPPTRYVGDGCSAHLGSNVTKYKVQTLLLHLQIASSIKCVRTVASVPNNKYLPNPKDYTGFNGKATKTGATSLTHTRPSRRARPAVYPTECEPMPRKEPHHLSNSKPVGEITRRGHRK